MINNKKLLEVTSIVRMGALELSKLVGVQVNTAHNWKNSKGKISNAWYGFFLQQLCSLPNSDDVVINGRNKILREIGTEYQQEFIKRLANEKNSED
jgi:hypothetical protein